MDVAVNQALPPFLKMCPSGECPAVLAVHHGKVLGKLIYAIPSLGMDIFDTTLLELKEVLNGWYEVKEGHEVRPLELAVEALQTKLMISTNPHYFSFRVGLSGHLPNGLHNLPVRDKPLFPKLPVTSVLSTVIAGDSEAVQDVPAEDKVIWLLKFYMV